MKKLTKTQKIILIIVIAAAAVIGGLFLIWALAGESEPELVEVPDVVGLYFEDAKDILKEAGFTVDVSIKPLPQDSDEESELKEGQIMEQDPEGGAMAEAGSEVKLYIAGPPGEYDEEDDPDETGEPVEVPDLTGKTQANAEYAIKAAGFIVGLVGTDYSDLPKGTVISQSPKAGQLAPAGGRLNFTLSLGPEAELVTVPNIKGMTESQAKQALQAVGLVYKQGNNITVNNLNDIGKVMDQRPSAGSSVEKGAQVTGDPGVGFTVKFIGWDNTVLKTEVVARGGNATAPSPPARTGYTFDKWSASFSNVQGNITVQALYTANPPAIIYFDVIVYTSDANKGTVSGGGTFEVGQAVSFDINYYAKPGFMIDYVVFPDGTYMIIDSTSIRLTVPSMPARDINATVMWKVDPNP